MAGPKFSFRARAFARFSRSITIRHFTKLAYDQNNQIDLDNSTSEDTATRAIVWFPTKAGFPRGGGRPGMGVLVAYFQEGALAREDYAAIIKSGEIVNDKDHVLIGNNTYRVFIRWEPVTDCGLSMLILKMMVGGVS